MRISTTSPMPPLGPYPHERLWPQVGRAPTKIRMSTINRMSEMDTVVSFCYAMRPILVAQRRGLRRRTALSRVRYFPLVACLIVQ